MAKISARKSRDFLKFYALDADGKPINVDFKKTTIQKN